MAIDWEMVLTRAGIEYQPGAGANIECRCPFCGSADEGKHLSISLEGRGWRCWRRPDEHRGIKPIRLLTHLLNISVTEARSIAGYSDTYSETGDGNSDFATRVRNALHSSSGHSKIVPLRNLVYPEHFRTIKEYDATKSIFNYLRYRGYSVAEVEGLTELYDLKTTLEGPFAWRVIIPIKMPNIGLVNWTARSTASSPYLRYRTLTTDPERSRAWGTPLATLQINQTLWNYDRIAASRAKNLVVCEGPFDAIRVDYFGLDTDSRATCLFGKSISDYQIALLEKVRDNYDNLLLVLDNDAEMEALKKLGRISHLDPRFLRLPPGVGDPAECSRQQLGDLLTLKKYG